MSIIEITTSDNKKAYIYSSTESTVYIDFYGDIVTLLKNPTSPHVIISEDFAFPGTHTGYDNIPLIKTLIVHDNFDNIPENIVSTIKNSYSYCKGM